ncbi:MAG: Bcr/CflA family drug resistance efflux transporter [Rhizobiales bacterium 32-66-11]|nr:MAG: Bcr/CflA family drug resistance efflux transporter [Rhizobiales bacterium 32-66-11]
MTPVMSQNRTAIIGALIVVIGPLSMSLYTPALPALVHAFDSTPSAMKLTLSVYFCGFAFSQLLCGPLSDAFGRRPAALGFFAVYVAGSLVAAFAPDMTWLVVGRGLQGIGVAAGPAISRAIVRDQFTGQASARILNLIGTMLAIGPALAPTVGGAILVTFGWHPIFFVMVAYGVLVVLLLAFAVPETNHRPDPAQARPARVFANYRTLFLDRGFMRMSLLIGFTLGGIYTLAAILPFVLIEKIGLSPTQFGFAMICQTGAYMLGTIVAGRLMKKIDAVRLIPVGLGCALVAAAGLVVVPPLFPHAFLGIMGPVALWAFGVAILLPGSTTLGLAGFPTMAGSAAALMGFMQIGGGFVGSVVASTFGDPTVALMLVVPGMGSIALLCFVLLRPRHGAAEPAVVPGQVDEGDLEIATDPAGLVGAAGDEIEAHIFRKSA